MRAFLERPRSPSATSNINRIPPPSRRYRRYLRSRGWIRFRQTMLTGNVAVILAAGLGTRLSVISGFLPKPLVTFEGIPLLEHVMSRAKQAGIERFVIVTGHQGHLVRRWFARSPLPHTPVTWVENPEYHKKNGISLLQARSAVNGPFLLLMSDHIFEPDTAASLLH